MIGQCLSSKNESAIGGVWDCSTNSTMESSTKNWSLWSTPLGALTTPPFFLNSVRGAETVWLKKRRAELKNVEQSSPKHPHSPENQNIFGTKQGLALCINKLYLDSI